MLFIRPNNKIKYIFIGFIVVIILVTLFVLLSKDKNRKDIPITQYEIDQQILEIKGNLGRNVILLDNLTTVSPDKRYIVYVTATDNVLTGVKLWIYNVKNKSAVIIDSFHEDIEEEKYTFFGGIAWNSSSSKFAYLKIWPTEIIAVDINDNLKKETVITKVNNKDQGVLNPSIGYQGKSFLAWTDENKILFENENAIPEAIYSINYNNHEIKEEYNINQTQNTDKSSFFSQRDPLWTDTQIGNCKEETMKSAGCAITSLSMVLHNFGYSTTPLELNNLLNDNYYQGYMNDCYVKWYVVPNFFNKVIFKGEYNSENYVERIDYELSVGNQVIVGFDMVEITQKPHWVVIIGKTTDGKYLINDPWDMVKTTKTLDFYRNIPDRIIVYKISNT